MKGDCCCWPAAVGGGAALERRARRTAAALTAAGGPQQTQPGQAWLPSALPLCGAVWDVLGPGWQWGLAK